MRSTDLFGVSTTEYYRQLAARSLRPAYDYRLLDENGATWAINPKAVRSRSRGTQLDESTWQMTLGINKSALPPGLTIKQYHTIEVDRTRAGVWPYFRGIVTKVTAAEVLDDSGAVLWDLTVECHGVLQKAKGYRINAFRYDPKIDSYTTRTPMLGIASTQRFSRNSAIAAPASETLPGTIYYALTETVAFAGLTISPNSDLSAPYVNGVNYTIDTSVWPPAVNWLISPAAIRYYRYYRVERIVAPRAGAMAITDATNATPIVVTSANHGLATGNQVVIRGVQGNTAANGVWTVTVLSANTYSLNGSVGSAGYTTGGHGTKVRGWYRLPVDSSNVPRNPDDLYQTTVASISGGTKCTPTDPTGYKTMLDVAQGEWITFRVNDQDVSAQVTAVNAGTGELTFAALPAGVVAGTPMRLSTCEYHQAWDDDRRIQFYDAHSAGTEYKPPRIQPAPNLGLAICNLTQVSSAYWATASRIWGLNARVIDDESATWPETTGLYVNRPEEMARVLLSGRYIAGVAISNQGSGYLGGGSGTFAVTFSGGGGTGAAAYATVSAGKVVGVTMTAYGRGYTSTPTASFAAGGGVSAAGTPYVMPAGFDLFSADDVTVGSMGVVFKNFAVAAMDLDELLRYFKEHFFPPNGYFHDTPDGKVQIKPFAQLATPQWELRGVRSITEEDRPEPVTATTIIGKGEPVNMAPVWFNYASGITDPLNALNGDLKNLSTVPAGAGNSGGWLFTVPRATPLQVFPFIDSVEIGGAGSQGLVTVYAVVDGSAYYVRGFVRVRIPNGGSLTLTQDDLNSVLTKSATDGLTLVVLLEHDESGTVSVDGKLASIKINVSRINAWRAQLTDDATLTQVPSDPTQFGDVWVQPDPTKRESWRYAPTNYLKRVSTVYAATGSAQGPRHDIREMTGISAQDTRNYAEAYQDEQVRSGKTYRVEAPLIDYAEIGDTVRVFRSDGTFLDLFLWGMDDSDAGENPDDLATYSMRDYAL